MLDQHFWETVVRESPRRVHAVHAGVSVVGVLVVRVVVGAAFVRMRRSVAEEVARFVGFCEALVVGKFPACVCWRL